MRIATSCIGEDKKLLPPSKLFRTILVKYVSGEACEITLPHWGSWLTGMKIPLMKIIGNLTREDNIITFAGSSVGRAAISTPIAEKQKLPRISPETRRRGWIITRSRKINARVRGKIVIRIPIRADAIMSPKRIQECPIGEEIKRSSVLVLVSQGAITGLIEVEVNHIDIPTSPEPSISGGISLPSQKARKKNKGKSIPKIMTGPFI